jgi:hypothetical protein
VRDVRSALLVAGVAVTLGLIACSSASSGGGDAGSSATCDENNGACAPECIPYTICTSEGSTCVIGGAACGHYWICHDTMWISDTAEDCDSGATQADGAADAFVPSDASLDGTADVTVDAPVDSSAADAAEAGGDGASDDGAASDGG